MNAVHACDLLPRALLYKHQELNDVMFTQDPKDGTMEAGYITSFACYHAVFNFIHMQ